MDKNSVINITVRNKQGILLADKVKAVTLYNDKGIFDILPKHENFISIIKNKIIVHKDQRRIQEIKIDTGIVRVYANTVNIYIGLGSH